MDGHQLGSGHDGAPEESPLAGVQEGGAQGSLPGGISLG